MLTFASAVIYFFLYSFAGWVWELVFIYVTERWWHLRAFLTLPLLPIYGFSALGILYVVEPYVHNPFLVFLAAAAIVTIIEYVVSLVLDKLFQVRLWDYTKWPLNLHGRVSLFSSMGFGVLGIFLLYILHPFLDSFVSGMSNNVVIVLGWVLVVILAIDFGNSLSSLVRVRIENARLQGTLDEIQAYIDSRVSEFRERNKKLRMTVEKWHRFNVRQIRKAFPEAKTTSRRKK